MIEDDIFAGAQRDLISFMENDILKDKICNVDPLTGKKMGEFEGLPPRYKRFFGPNGVAYDEVAERIAVFKGLEPGSYDATTLILETIEEYLDEKDLSTPAGERRWLGRQDYAEIERTRTLLEAWREKVPIRARWLLDDPEAIRFLANEALDLVEGRPDDPEEPYAGHPGLDVDRAVVVLARTARIVDRPMVRWPKRSVTKSGAVFYPGGIGFLPDIGLALKHLSPDEALSLFEHEDLEVLARRQVYTDYLATGGAPLFTPKGCAAEIDRLLKHQEANRDSLVRSGLPARAFRTSVLLGAQMADVYPFGLRPSAGAEGEGGHALLWTMERWPDPEGQRDRAEAPLEPGLSIQDAAGLESLRGRMLDLRVKALTAIARGLRGGDPKAMWKGVKDAILGEMSAADAYFLLGIDGSPSGYELAYPKSPLSSRGALSALLSLAGHCEKELTIGTMAETRKVLTELIVEKRLNGEERPGWPRLVFGSYYEVLGTPQQERVEAACDTLWEMELQEVGFWSEYIERVNRALAGASETAAEFARPVVSGYETHYLPSAEAGGIEPLMTKEDVAKIIKRPPKTVMNFYRAGELPGHKIGKLVRFAPAEVRRFIEGSEASGGMDEEPEEDSD